MELRLPSAAAVLPQPGLPFRSIARDLADRAATMGAAQAFRFVPDRADAPPQIWTWAALHARAGAVASELQAAEIRAGQRVLLAYPTGLDFIAALMGCFHAGVVAVPVSPPRPRERFSRLAHILRDADAAAILCAPGLHSAIAGQAGGVACLTLRGADPARTDLPAPAPRRPLSPDDLAFLQYSSGSTGAPKGVMVTHGMLAANLKHIQQAFDFRPDDRICGWLPHYHDMGLIGGILTPVYLGIPNAMMSPAAFLRDPIRYLELASQSGATVIGGPNFAFDHLARHATPDALRRVDLSRLRLAFSGAEAIRADILRRFQEALSPCCFRLDMWVGCYGMAEATLCVTVTRPGTGVRMQGGYGDSGVPAQGLDVAIVAPDTGRRVTGQAGEILLRGPSIASSYWRQPDETNRVFDQQLDGIGGWMRTGDLGLMQDGRLFVTGRIKEMIVVRGQNHAPQAIEDSVSAAHPAILPGRVAAFPLGEGDGGIGIAAELDRHACRDPQPVPIFDAIRQVLTGRHGLAADRITLIRPGALPVTPSGKIQRFACREGLAAVAEWCAGATPTATPAQPRGELARALNTAPAPLRRSRLLAHLRQALADATHGRAAPADDRPFFDMGVDSASGLALIGGLEQALDLPLEATLIYEHTTPAALADHLLARLQSQGATDAI